MSDIETKVLNSKASDSPLQCCEVLKRGGVIIYPTETLYGIGVNAESAESIKRVFEIKRRSHANPVLILVRDVEMMSAYVRVTDVAGALAKEFMPGPLTMVLEDKGRLPDMISAGTGKVAVRVSGAEFVKKLFEYIDFPITSTSANISGEQNLFASSELIDTFSGIVDLIVDSGNLPPTLGSTIIDLTSDPIRALREGAIGLDKLKEYL